jgi:cell division protein FtsI/penicillin-binding protein 2
MPLAFAAIVEHGGHGSTVAAPIVVEIMETWLGISPEAQGGADEE